jgi:hypothetical protein
MTMTQKSNIVMKEVDAKTSGMHCVFDHTHCTASHTPTAVRFWEGGISSRVSAKSGEPKPLGPYGTRRDCLWYYD